jgi:plastocyanin
MRRFICLIAIGVSIACGGDDGGPTNGTVAAVQITTSTATLRLGEQSQFTAIALDASGREIQNAGAVAWSSSAPSVATVNQSGLVTGNTAGTTSITATVQSVLGTRLVTVLPPGAAAVVTMPGNSFIPTQVTVRVGEQVFFEFPRTPHNVIFQKKAGVPQDIQVTSNTTVPRQFGTAGQFPYDCTLHPGMTGVVVVNP